MLAGVTLSQQKASQPDQLRLGQTAPVAGLSATLMVPLVKTLLANRLPNATLELAFYDRAGRFVHRQQVRVNKTARQDWQLLHIKTQVPADGFVAVRMQNRSKTPVWFDDVWLDKTPQNTPNAKAVFDNFPALLRSSKGFATQADTSPQELYRATDDDCEEEPNTVDGGMLNVDVNVKATRTNTGTPPGNNGSNSGGDEGGGPAVGNPNGEGGGSGNSNTTIFSPYGAPNNAKRGDSYRSPYTGVLYVWDGENWCIVLADVDVKGTPPTNTYQGRNYVYYDETYGYSIRYTYLNGHWTLPVESVDPKKIKVVGRDEFNEEKDYRLYQKPCEAYEYMFNKALASNSEVGALITERGIIMLPNSSAFTNSDGTKQFSLGAYPSDSGGYFMETTDGKVYISGMIHTHPGPFANGTPSPTDLQTALDYNSLGHYIITGFYMNNFTADRDAAGKPKLATVQTVYNQQTAKCPQ